MAVSWLGDAPEARVLRMVAAARRLADPHDPFGQRARDLLPAATGLSRAGVDYALIHCLETQPTPSELASLVAQVPSTSRAHVLLSANVFVAAHRAIALAAAASPRVEVRASRREPLMAELLHEASGGLFRLVDELAPLPGEHVWAYGRDTTLRALRGDLPSGVVLHPHGDGLGVAVVRTPAVDADALAQVRSVARSLAHDVVAFDQRGCLSPRVAFVLGEAPAARELGAALARELAALEHEVPRGEVSPDERGDFAVYRDTMLYAAEVFPAGLGLVGVDVEQQRVLVPPVGRVFHVVRVDDLEALGQLASDIAAVGVAGPNGLWDEVHARLPRARVSAIGKMQRPRLDGPVDRRPDPAGEVL